MLPDKSSPQAPTALPDAPVVSSRRLLLRGGLAGGTGLLTLAAKPVSATTCTQASSFASLNLSRPNLMSSCSGRKPSFWSASSNFAAWPASCSPVNIEVPKTKATRFGDVFTQAGDLKKVTMLEVLAMSDETGSRGVAKYCAAAYLNALKGHTPATVLSTQTVQSIWSSFVNKGHYEPTAGVKWYPDESKPPATGGLIAWLKTTMPA